MFDAMKDSCEYPLLTQIPASLPLLCQGGTEDKVNFVLGDVHRSRSDRRDLDAVVQGSEHFESSDPRYGVRSHIESIGRSEHQDRLPAACEKGLQEHNNLFDTTSSIGRFAIPCLQN